MTNNMKTEPVVTMLAALDFTADSDDVVPRAAELATRFGASLELVHALEDVADKEDRDRRWKVATEQLDRLLSKYANGDVAAATSVLEGVAGPALVEEMNQRKADLIVMGFHRDRPLGGVTLGSCMRHVIAHTDRDVLLTGRRSRVLYGAAVVAWDGEKPIGPAVARAKYFAPEAELSIFQMVNSAADAEPARRWLADALCAAGTDDLIENLLVSSDPLGPALIDAVSSVTADLLVMPTRGGQHGDIGYTAEKIIAERACDTLCCQASCRD